jgi:hypothetical protein
MNSSAAEVSAWRSGLVAELFIVVAEQPWASGDSDKQQSTGIDKVHHLGSRGDRQRCA